MRFDSDWELFLTLLTESEIPYIRWMIFLKITKMKDLDEASFKKSSDKIEIGLSLMPQMVALEELLQNLRI